MSATEAGGLDLDAIEAPLARTMAKVRRTGADPATLVVGAGDNIALTDVLALVAEVRALRAKVERVKAVEREFNDPYEGYRIPTHRLRAALDGDG